MLIVYGPSDEITKEMSNKNENQTKQMGQTIYHGLKSSGGPNLTAQLNYF